MSVALYIYNYVFANIINNFYLFGSSKCMSVALYFYDYVFINIIIKLGAYNVKLILHSMSFIYKICIILMIFMTL